MTDLFSGSRFWIHEVNGSSTSIMFSYEQRKGAYGMCIGFWYESMIDDLCSFPRARIPSMVMSVPILSWKSRSGWDLIGTCR